MLFNVKKCKVLHIGHKNAYCDYSMNGEILQSVTEETDLGIIVSNDLKHGCILEGIGFLSILSILLPTRKSGIRHFQRGCS